MTLRLTRGRLLDHSDAARDVLAPRWGCALTLEVGGFGWNGLASLLGEDPRTHPLSAGPNTFSRFDVEVKATSYGGQYHRWLRRQWLTILEGGGSRCGDMLVDVRGRAYSFPRRGAGPTGTANGPGK